MFSGRLVLQLAVFVNVKREEERERKVKGVDWNGKGRHGALGLSFVISKTT